MRFKTLLLLTAFTVFSGLNAFVSGQGDSGQGFSISIESGALYATDGQGMVGGVAGNFNIASQRNMFYGGSVRYDFNPAWALEGVFHTGVFENERPADPYYRNEFLAFSLRGTGNLNSIFNLNWPGSRIVKPYVTIGAGAIKSDLEADDLTYDGTSLSLVTGIGVSLALTPMIDLFGGYDYHFVAGDLLDGESAGTSSDQYANLRGGIRVNFGRGTEERRTSERTDPPVRSEPDVPVQAEEEPAEEEPAEEAEQIAQDPLEERVEERLSEQDERIDQYFTETNERIREIRSWVSGLETLLSPMLDRMDEIEQQQSEIKSDLEALRNLEAPRATREGMMETPSAGHYVQVYSSRTRENADSIRRNAISMLEGDIADPENSVVIYPYRNYFRVLIGVFESYGQAQSVLPYVRDTFEDAFVITYPRP